MKGRILKNVASGAAARAVSLAALGALAVGASLAIAAAGPANSDAKAAPPAPPTAAERAITYRKAMYQVMYNNFAPVGAMASGKIPYDAKMAAIRTERVAFLAQMIGEGFPDGSNAGVTKAKAEIWSNRADFDAKMKDLQDKSAALASVAKNGDLATLKPAFGDLAGACKACHDKYKAD